MRRYLLGWSVVLLLLPAGGCGQGGRMTPVAPPEAEAKAVNLDAGALDPPLADLLQKPRAELAQLSDETLQVIAFATREHEAVKPVDSLLHDVRLPLVIPVFREAKFTPALGFSVPPYLAEGQHDNELALHLARHGDAEAARKLADPAGKDTLARIDALKAERNYPVEWTRLVALKQHLATVRLATGDPDAAAELVAIHKQLRQVLDKKAAEGDLGRALLPRGRRILQLAAEAWQEGKRTALADQAGKILTAWGDVAPDVAIPMGASRQEVARILRTPPGTGSSLSALNTLRAFDVLSLPFPERTAQVVTASFDRDNRLAGLTILYRTKTGQTFRDPAHLALVLEDSQVGTTDGAKETGVRRSRYSQGETACEVTLVQRSPLVSALVRWTGKGTPVPPELPRDFGVVSLDRSFESNRVRLAKEQRDDTVQSNRADALASLVNPLPLARAMAISVSREPNHPATSTVTIRYTPVEAGPEAAELLPLLWSAWGEGRWEGVDDGHGGHLAFIWEDATTRVTIRAPYAGEEPLVLEARDRRPDEKRDAATTKGDRGERQKRLAAGKPLVRLPRSADGIEITLGMNRAAALAVLPEGKGVFSRDIPDGTALTIARDPVPGARAIPREVFVRFGPDSKVAEVRVRYQDLAGGQGVKDILAALRKKCGAPEEEPGKWGSLWPDMGSPKPGPVLSSWRDDVTLLTCQADGVGAEVTLRDCPPAHEDGVPLPALECLTRGPEGVVLGDDRDALIARWKIDKLNTLADGALMLTPAKAGPYDTLLVYFSGDKVSRVLARHVQTKAAKGAEALQEAWGRELPKIGWPRRQDLGPTKTLQTLGFHDDRTCLRLFWQENSQGVPRVFTEWRDAGR